MEQPDALALLEELKHKKALFEEQKHLLAKMLTSPVAIASALATGVGISLFKSKRPGLRRLAQKSVAGIQGIQDKHPWFPWEILTTAAIFGFKKILQYPIFHKQRRKTL